MSSFSVIKSLSSVLSYCMLCFSGLWFLGFVVFIQHVLSSTIDDGQTTDLIVVLTGGDERIDEGLKLLEEKKGRWLFISGVNRAVSLRELLASRTSHYTVPEEKIILGKEAMSTKGNVDETKQWVYAHSVRSLRLVTANYHMPRSLAQFQKALSHVKIVPHPVALQLKKKRLWQWPRKTWIFFVEYNKLLFLYGKSYLSLW